MEKTRCHQCLLRQSLIANWFKSCFFCSRLSVLSVLSVLPVLSVCREIRGQRCAWVLQWCCIKGILGAQVSAGVGRV